MVGYIILVSQGKVEKEKMGFYIIILQIYRYSIDCLGFFKKSSRLVEI